MRVSFLLKLEDDLFGFFEIKKKSLHTCIIERLDLLYSNFNDMCCFLCIYTENNYYINQNACA